MKVKTKRNQLNNIIITMKKTKTNRKRKRKRKLKIIKSLKKSIIFKETVKNKYKLKNIHWITISHMYKFF